MSSSGEFRTAKADGWTMRLGAKIFLKGVFAPLNGVQVTIDVPFSYLFRKLDTQLDVHFLIC